jgi:type VI secretion system protein ImpH
LRFQFSKKGDPAEMGTPRGTKSTRLRLSAVESHLKSEPFSFSFFQAVRLIHLLLESKPVDFAGSPNTGFRQRGVLEEPRFVHVGFTGSPEKEAVSFVVNNTLEFPASELQALEWSDGQQPRLSVNFMGLTGPGGVLPSVYTQAVIEMVAWHKDPSTAAFFDMFNHRMISLFYRAWEKHRFHLPLERGEEDSRLSRYLRAIVGILPDAFHNRLMERPQAPGRPAPLLEAPSPDSDAGSDIPETQIKPRRGFPDRALLYYAGLLSLKPRSAAALGSVIGDYFDLPVRIEQFVGTWYRLEDDNQFRSMDDGRFQGQLGVSSVIGDEIWDQQSRARIALGPLTRSRYEEFLPDGNGYVALRALLQFLFGPEIGFDLQLVLKREEVPAAKLDDSSALRLGWLTWLKSREEFDRVPNDTILVLN